MPATGKYCTIVRTTDRTRLRVGLLAALLTLPWPAQAGRDVGQDEALQLVEQGELQRLEVIVNDALTRYPGRMLEAELEFEEGRYIYEIEIVTRDGRVMELEYDGASGKLIDVEEDG